MSEELRLYRVIFTQDEKKYEIFSRYLSEESLVGFIEAEELVFSDEDSSLLKNIEEKIRIEFQGVKRCYIPIHMILRIDELECGEVLAEAAEHDNSNITPFPTKGSGKKTMESEE